jgi:hypothetical protein
MSSIVTLDGGGVDAELDKILAGIKSQSRYGDERSRPIIACSSARMFIGPYE